MPDERWREPAGAPTVLAPLAADPYPYPFELDLPAWTVESDVDFRRWLFAYGSELLIEQPEFLRAEHRTRASELLDGYRQCQSRQ